MYKWNYFKKYYIIGICTLILFAVIFLISNIGIFNKNKNIEDLANSEQLLYGEFKTNTNWNTDPTITENIFKGNKDKYNVIEIVVKSIKDTSFISEDSPFPYTAYEVDLKDVLKGNINEKISTIYISGGNIKISDLINHLDKEDVEKMGFNRLNKLQKETSYIKYCTDYDYNLKVGEEYTIIVSKSKNGEYLVLANGYGIFKEDDDSSGKLKNVLSKNDLIDENGVAIIK